MNRLFVSFPWMTEISVNKNEHAISISVQYLDHNLNGFSYKGLACKKCINNQNDDSVLYKRLNFKSAIIYYDIDVILDISLD